MPERDWEVKLALGEVPGAEVVPLPVGTVPVEKPPETDEDVKLAGPDVVPFDVVAGEVGTVVWTVMLIVLVNVWVNVTVEFPAVSVQVVVQIEVELLVLAGEPGVLELPVPVTCFCQPCSVQMYDA